MRLLLLTDIPPSENLTAGLVLADIVRGLPAGSVACFCALNTHLKPVLPSDLHDMPIGVTPKPVESGVQIGRSVFLSRLATIFREAKRRTIDSRRIAREAIEFARAHKCDAVWAVLQGQTMSEVAAPVARALGAPLYTMVWDPLSWWLREHQIDRVSRAFAHRAFARSMRASRACAVASPEMAQAYAERYGVRCVPVIAGRDAKRAAGPARSFRTSGEIVIGMAGQFYARQEWDQLLTALHHADWRVGTRRVRVKVFSDVTPPGEPMPGRVEYMGYRPREEVGRVLAEEADLLYCPYPFAPHMEEVAQLSFPSKLSLYLSCGRPVLFHGPKQSAPYRYLERRAAGLLCGDLEAPAVYNAIVRLVEEPRLYERLAAKGARAFIEDFTLTRMLASFHEMLAPDGATLSAPSAAPKIRGRRLKEALRRGAALAFPRSSPEDAAQAQDASAPGREVRLSERVELRPEHAQVELGEVAAASFERTDGHIAADPVQQPFGKDILAHEGELEMEELIVGDAMHTHQDAAYVLQAELNRIAAELDRARSELFAALRREESLSSALTAAAHLESRLNAAVEEVELLKVQLAASDPEPLRAEIVRLEQALTVARTEHNSSREALMIARAEQGASEERLVLRKQIELLQQEAALRRETDALRLDFAVAQAVHAGALENAALRSKVDISALEAALAAKVRDVEVLRDNVAALTLEVEAAHAAAAEARTLREDIISAVEAATASAELRTAGRISLVNADLQTIKRVSTHKVIKSGDAGEGLRAVYLDLLEAAVCGVLSGDPNNDRWGDKSFDPDRRSLGRDWPRTAQTMIGAARLRNIRVLLEQVLASGIEGDILEAGVWRGGACIYVRGILMAHGVEDRTVWVADSFQGLPEPDARYPEDAGDRHHEYDELAVSVEEVRSNFARYGLLDEKVRFLVGWFADTLPHAPIRKLAMLRLDGDMYSSTMETLEALYDKVSDGGFIIVDDYILKPCRAAVDEFRSRRGIVAELVEVDGAAVYWRKSQVQERSVKTERKALSQSGADQLS